MKTGWKILLGLAGAFIGYQIYVHISLTEEKNGLFRVSRTYCDQKGKPLLRIGMRRAEWEPPNGDATVDIDPAVLEIPGGVWASELDMPFADKQFGVCFNEHTLEHLPNLSDVQKAVKECVRVSDVAVFTCPNPSIFSYSTWAEPGHLLRVWFDQSSNTIRVKPNEYITGIGGDQGADLSHPPPVGYRGPVKQSLITTEIPIVMEA